MELDKLNFDFFRSKHQILKYQKKEGTKTRFYLMEGEKGILPEGLSFIPYSGKEGRLKAFYEIDGRYKLTESGLYSAMNNRNIHTKFFSVSKFPFIMGWGEIDARFQIYDLLILISDNGCQRSFEIHHFKGLAKPEYLESVCYYLQRFLNDKSQP